MTTADPKAAARRRRAKARRKGLHDAKVLLIGALLGAMAWSMILMANGVFNHPATETPTTTPATVVHKSYHTPTGSYDLDHEDTGDYVQTEDGTWVPRGYYSQRSGPTQAVCDYLGKVRVPDPIYGSRCL